MKLKTPKDPEDWRNLRPLHSYWRSNALQGSCVDPPQEEGLWKHEGRLESP